MSTAPAVAPGETVTKEYRIAVVMYGGISLAIYMNGIAQELLALVRSTSNSNQVGGTDAVYRNLAAMLSDEQDGKVHARFVIDIISGTSAGGINGIFLAKALAQGTDIQSLKETWVEEGDFQKLLNDQAWKEDITLPRQVPPQSLLSGERMFVKLFEAFAKMDQSEGTAYVDDLELSVTTTDLRGKVLPLRLADRVVFERKYRQAFRFRYSQDPPANDFGSENTPFLAFAARCTSSFPVAFEPMQLAAIRRLINASKFGKKYSWTDGQWQSFFGPREIDVSDSERFFADGGYLDNHPFDHAIGSLTRRSSPTRSERKLLYIEPSPEHPERKPPPRDKDGKAIEPDAIENAWDGLAGIPGKQPIRDSLLTIQRRNRLIRKVNNVVSAISEAVELSAETRRTESAHGATVQRSAKQTFPLSQDPSRRAYEVLNIYSVTDDIAVRIARFKGFDDDSDYVYAIRCLVKVWREREYAGNERQFLLDFDISYRVRKFQFVKSQLQLLSCLDHDANVRLAKLNLSVPKEQREEFRTEIAKVMVVLDSNYRKILAASRNAASSSDLANAIDALGIELRDLNMILGVGYVDPLKQRDPSAPDISLAPLLVIDQRAYEDRAAEVLRRVPGMDQKLTALKTVIAKEYAGAMEEARIEFTGAISDEKAGTPMGKLVLRLARMYFYGFQEFDAAIFPIIFGTDTGELVPVDVVRISPEDATAIQDESKTGRPKLAGASFGAFGAFLERYWRTNDILWGRLDGAERIICALAGQHPGKDTLIRQAHDIIIAEELTKSNRDEICKMLIEALLRTDADGVSSDQRAQELIAEIENCVRAPVGSTEVNLKLQAVLRNVLTTDQLRKTLEDFQISREPNRAGTLENVARSARIVGQILSDIGRKRPLLKKPGATLVQAANVLWGMVEVAIPRSLWNAVFLYWFGLAMLFSVVMIVGGMIFSQPVQQLGINLLVLAFLARLAVAVLGGYVQGNTRLLRLLAILVILVGVIIFALGLVELRELYVHPPWVHATAPVSGSNVPNGAGH